VGERPSVGEHRPGCKRAVALDYLDSLVGWAMNLAAEEDVEAAKSEKRSGWTGEVEEEFGCWAEECEG
jgi:hypothetical protein